MRFARIVFTGAGVLGILVLTPLFFLRDLSGRVYADPWWTAPQALPILIAQCWCFRLIVDNGSITDEIRRACARRVSMMPADSR